MRRLRIRYTKDGKSRFLSARDLASVWGRALRRAGIPIAYSEGFTPHPKMSFPDALPVGVASTGEYAEMTLAGQLDTPAGMARLSETLPPGMWILAHRDAPPGAPKLPRLLEATIWEVVYPSEGDTSATLAQLRTLARAVMDAEHAIIIRTRSTPGQAGAGDTKSIDLRPSIVAMDASLRAADQAAAPTLRATLRNDGPSVRPGDLHRALSSHLAPDDEPLPTPRLLRRVVQGSPVDGGVAEALGGDLVHLCPEVAR